MTTQILTPPSQPRAKGIAIFRMFITFALILLSLANVYIFARLLPNPLMVFFVVIWGFMAIYASLVFCVLWLFRRTPPEVAKLFGWLLASYLLLALAFMIANPHIELFVITAVICLGAYLIELVRVTVRYVTRH